VDVTRTLATFPEVPLWWVIAFVIVMGAIIWIMRSRRSG
jgi:hypothetical protein